MQRRHTRGGKKIGYPRLSLGVLLEELEILSPQGDVSLHLLRPSQEGMSNLGVLG